MVKQRVPLFFRDCLTVDARGIHAGETTGKEHASR